jgi:hypothetical protein
MVTEIASRLQSHSAHFDDPVLEIIMPRQAQELRQLLLVTKDGAGHTANDLSISKAFRSHQAADTTIQDFQPDCICRGKRKWRMNETIGNSFA